MPVNRRHFLAAVALSVSSPSLTPAATKSSTEQPMRDYTAFEFADGDIAHTVYHRGSGPPVLIMHELPGMTLQCLRLANDVRERGYTVFLPLFFGSPGQDAGIAHAVALCVSHEFRCLATDASSPITQWLRALARHIAEMTGASAIGAIGMCLTGGFVLSLMLEPKITAPVMSQPSLPLLPLSYKRRAALGIAPNELVEAKKRAIEGLPILGLRFSEDSICPKERFQRMRDEFGPGFRSIEIDSSSGNLSGIRSSAHAVLTKEFVNRPEHPTYAALQTVLAFLDERLKAVR